MYYQQFVYAQWMRALVREIHNDAQLYVATAFVTGVMDVIYLRAMKIYTRVIV